MSLDRRSFVHLLAAAPAALALADETNGIPKYRIVSPYAPQAAQGIPGPYPGKVVSVHSQSCLDKSGNHTNAAVVKEMMESGICSLTGDTKPTTAWKRFFSPSDVVAIKVNCGGVPHVVSSPAIVAECVRNLGEIGIPPSRIYVYERFQVQLNQVKYRASLPDGVNLFAAEADNSNRQRQSYDPDVYVDADFFGEEDTRSNLMKLISRTVTKVINIPTVKDHSATGVTGCLKNIAYGSFSNVARTHSHGISHTYSFVGTLAGVEPLRSKTVLQIMDGMRGVWHGGPFAPNRRFLFYPRQIMFGTDPVAIDRILLEIVEQERRRNRAISVWNRSRRTLQSVNRGNWTVNPNVNIFVREPGHIAYAAKLGLGTSDLKKIEHMAIKI